MHPDAPELAGQSRRGRVNRRAVMRVAALLGLSPLAIRHFLAGVGTP